MSAFLEKHAQHLSADELKDYAHLEGVPQLVQDCLVVFEKDSARQETELEESLGEQAEKQKEDLQEEFSTLEEKLFEIVRTSSYEDLEEKLELAFSHFRLMMQIEEA